MDSETKVIFKNRSNLLLSDAAKLVTMVIDLGLISDGGRQYCYASRFQLHGKEYMVYANRTPSGTHVFTVTNSPYKTQ
jgi:hypothetical protein